MLTRAHLNWLFLILLLSACSGLTVEKTPLKNPTYPSEDAQPSPIGFNKIRFAIPTGTPMASYSPKGLLGLLKCAGPYTVVQGRNFSRGIPGDNYKSIFLETMEAQGYDVAGDPGRLFDEQEDIMRSAYSIGARVTDMKIDLCREVNIWGTPKGETGEASLTIEWSVFDLLNRKNVYKTTVKGYTKRKIPNHDGIPLLIEDAFAASAHNFGAEQEFHDLIFFGEEPKNKFKTIRDPFEESVRIYNPNEHIVLQNKPLSRISAQGQMNSIRKTTVMIQAANTHGSGFFITNEGHILTNYHVVGNATRVRIVTADKKHKLKAEVLRTDRRRDVALLKLEEMPEHLKIQTRPIRTEEPSIGEDTYAIGAPRLKRLQDTVTKGIISAYRYNPREKQHYIQSDVEIHGGNSGGPLLDGKGNIIGLSVSGYITDDSHGLSGLNNFIPIHEALEKLDIQIN